MNVLLQIKDQQAAFVMELRSKFPFVKAKALTPQKMKHLQDFHRSVKEMEDHLSGKKSLKSARDLLGEL